MLKKSYFLHWAHEMSTRGSKNKLNPAIGWRWEPLAEQQSLSITEEKNSSNLFGKT